MKHNTSMEDRGGGGGKKEAVDPIAGLWRNE
jgi:hypothetical protein